MKSEYVSVLEMVEQSSGNAKKAVLMSGDEFLQEMLIYAYDPLSKYYIKKLPWEGQGTKTLAETKAIWNTLLDNSSSRFLSGHKQQHEFKRFIEILKPEEAELFKKIVKKDLKLGIGVKTINAVFDNLIPEFGFMKAHPYDPGRLKKGSYMSLKIDCIRAMLRGRTLYSSGGRVIPGVQHIAKAYSLDEEFDGELTIPGLDFDAASGRIRSNDDCPTAIFNVFDMPSSRRPFKVRYQELVERSKYFLPHTVLLKHVIATGNDHIQRTFAKALDNGHEGLVIKSSSHQYELKRSWDWMKMKAEDPEEVRIVGFNEGTGKYAGSLGSVQCKRSNGVIVDVSGFKDHIKDHIWNNKELWLDEIIEINFHQETPDGSLRHPRFAQKRDFKIHRHRWDKSGKPLDSWD